MDSSRSPTLSIRRRRFYCWMMSFPPVCAFQPPLIDLIHEYKFPEIFQSLDISGDTMAKASDILRVPDPDPRQGR
ncbi:hypothetical protein B0H17DRAFT_1215475 [Mycena rosella]|uniref:Uncharacterized protein n=1 Tax=Mycena rosella TaxID=1033263 RepID=A0AAD7CH75_MYCRO|nr:hypothetical protein B0H17DRAFT_1215475 [Mycena rosella]